MIYSTIIMGYLERNAETIGEINAKTSTGEVVLFRRERVGVNRRGTTEVFPIGSFHSSTTGNELFLALKKYGKYSQGGHKTQVLVDLAAIAVIADGIPEYAPEVPQVFGLLVSKSNQELGVLIEDFSKGGSEKVVDAPYSALPTKIRRIKPSADNEEVANMSFLVGPTRRRRLGDFDKLPVGMDSDIYEATFGGAIDVIFDDLGKFTVKVDKRKHLR